MICVIKSNKVIHHQDELRRMKRFLGTIKRKLGITAFKATKHSIKMCNYVDVVDRRVTRWRAMILLYGRLPY